MAIKQTKTKVPVKQKAIIYIAKSHLDIYIENSTQVVRFDYPDTAIRDMEVINKDLLFVQITTLIENNKIPAADALVVLSPASVFEKKFPIASPTQSTEIQMFLDNVPFENIASKTLKLKKEVQVIAANRDMYDSIEYPFKKHGFTIVAVIPFFAAVEKAEELQGGLSPQLAKMLIQKFDSLKQQNMIPIADPDDYQSFEKKEEEIEVKQSQKKHEFTLIGIFGFLVSILIIMVVINFILPQKKPATTPPTQPAVVAPTEIPTPTLIPTPEEISSASAQLEKEKLKINILNGSGIVGQADRAKKALEAAGFKNIQTGNASTNNPKTLIVFASSVKQQIKDIITEETKKLFNEVSVQETAEASFDVIITTGAPLPTTKP